MKKRIVMITGSPRKGGNTNALAAAFRSGAEAAGHEVRVFDAAAAKLEGCHADGNCVDKGFCCNPDDNQQVHDLMVWGNVLVLVSPVYWKGFTAQIKQVIDRFYAYVAPKGQEACHIEESYLIAAGMIPDDSVFEAMKLEFEHINHMLGFKDAGKLLAPGIAGEGDALKDKNLMKLAIEMGYNVGKEKQEGEIQDRSVVKKNIICSSCDNNCLLEAEFVNGELKTFHPLNGPRSFCEKPFFWKDYRHHPDRILHPLKNTGKRGEQKWVQISWDQALDEISERLKKIIDKYGAESVAYSTQPINTGDDQGMLRRFFNLLGTPNYMTGMNMCFGNTIQVHRCTYGNNQLADYSKAKCIVLLGHNPHRRNWASEANALEDALERGAKLIVLDPRTSENTRRAHLHLPLRYGTDAAMLLGFINIIIEEELYDKDFVDKYTVGFDQLRQRVKEYPVDKVAGITGCDPEMIRQAARMYATSGGSIIPWGPIPDMQVNGTSAARCTAILISICGFLNKTEMLQYPDPDLVSCSVLELHGMLPMEQKLKQLGTEKYPLLTYKGYEMLREPNKKVFGKDWLNLFTSFMCNPASVFEAMRGEGPYPVKAFFALGSNALMCYVNQRGAFHGLMNQDLIVVQDHWLTPTAQLADYILPSDYYMERPALRNQDHSPAMNMQQQLFPPLGESRNMYDLLKGLADRMGLSDYFPWKTFKDVLDYRLQKTGKTFDDLKDNPTVLPSKGYDPFTEGFATPSGKIELYSSVFESLGLDPLPYYREPAQTPISNPELAKEYPLTMFVGVRDKALYLTNYRQIEGMRKHNPYPEAFVHPADAARAGVADGDWIWVETTHDRIMLKTLIDAEQPEGTIRIPHGWWMPELPPGLETGLSGAMLFNDAMILPDDDWNTDREQGIPNLRGGLLAKIYKAEQFTV